MIDLQQSWTKPWRWKCNIMVGLVSDLSSKSVKISCFFCRWSSSASAGWSSWLATIQLLTKTCKPVRLGSSLSHECSLALANASLPLQKPAHSVVRVL